MINVMFSVNVYDGDGDIARRCVDLHFSDHGILRLAGLNEFDDLISQLQHMCHELAENWEYKNSYIEPR